jgi:hypothetical protein
MMTSKAASRPHFSSLPPGLPVLVLQTRSSLEQTVTCYAFKLPSHRIHTRAEVPAGTVSLEFQRPDQIPTEPTNHFIALNPIIQ